MLAAALLPWLFVAPPTPTLRAGDELVYSGDAVEECLRRESPYRRCAKLQVRAFVLAKREASTDLAVLTLIQLQDDAGIVKVAVEVTGAAKESARLHAQVRLELLRLSNDGSFYILQPESTAPPILLNESTRIAPMPEFPIDEMNTLETGMFLARGLAWEARPAIVLDGAEAIERTAILTSPQWERPALNERPWCRSERVWCSPADHVARILWRRVERNDGPRPAFRIETRLDLQPSAPPRGETITRITREIETAWHFNAEASRSEPAVLLAKIRRYCEETAATPYREAVEAVARRIAK